MSGIPSAQEPIADRAGKVTTRWRGWFQRGLFGANTWTGVQTFEAGINLGNETLSVYDEGTFTPTIAFGGASVGVTYSLQAGSYVRIGSLVAVHIQMTLTSRGSSTGAVTIGTLPFTPAALTSLTGSPNNYTIGAGLFPTFDTSGTNIALRTYNPSTGNRNPAAETMVDNDFSILLAGSFRV